MSQLSQLIEQARSQKGLDDLFNSPTVQRASVKDERVNSDSSTLMSKLDALEVELFPCTHLSSNEVNEMINTLESVLEDI